MSGFDNDVMYANNVDFTGSNTPTAQITASGQLSIGTGSNPAISTGKIVNSDGSLNIGYSSPNITIAVATGTQVGKTITGDDLTPLPPIAGNWYIRGQKNGTIPVMYTSGTSNILSIEDRTSTTEFVVDPSSTPGQRGTFTTIQSAVTAASSGTTIFIKDGTYTENITLSAGVNLTAYNTQFTPGVKIKGKCSFTGAGTVTISGIALETNGDFCVSVTGSSASNLYLTNCTIKSVDSTAIQLSSSSGSAFIRITSSWIFSNAGTSGVFSVSGAGGMYLFSVNSSESIATTVQSTFSANGVLRIEASNIRFPITTSGTGRIAATTSNFNTTVGTERTALTLGSTGTTADNLSNYIRNCNLLTGTATSLVMSADLLFFNNSVSSNNSNPISGTGNLLMSGTTYAYSFFIPSTTTITMQRRFIDGGRYVGDWSGGTVSAGSIGEMISSKVAFNAGVSLTTDTTALVTNISLTPGTWSVSGIVMFTSITTGTYQDGSISTDNGAITSASYGENTISSTFTSTTAEDVGVSIPSYIIQVTPVAGTTTTYLKARAGFSAGSAKAYGTIRAIRIC